MSLSNTEQSRRDKALELARDNAADLPDVVIDVIDSEQITKSTYLPDSAHGLSVYFVPCVLCVAVSDND